jgi:hypothetical protein
MMGQAEKAFDVGEEVCLNDARSGRRTYTIAEARLTAARRWEYRLEAQGSKWYAESQLSWP